MERFKEIDPKLEELAAKLGATLTKDRPNYPEGLRTFEERRIDWIDNGIKKAIIIQPTFELAGVNSTIWNFVNLAWLEDGGPVHKLRWKKELVDKQKFEFIESNIDQLLIESEEALASITINNLK